MAIIMSIKEKKSIPLCILLCIFEAFPFTDTLHVSLHSQTLMQMVQLFINLVLKYPQSVSAGDTFFKVPISAESIRILLGSRIEASFVPSDLPFHILLTSLRPGRGSCSCGAFVFFKCLKLKGLSLKSLFASLECLHTLTSHSSVDRKKHKNFCELSVKELVFFFLSDTCPRRFRTSGMLAAGLDKLVLVAAPLILHTHPPPHPPASL